MTGGKLIPVVVLLLLASGVDALAQDMVQLVDGRFVGGPAMTRTKDGVTVHFKNGDVRIPSPLVKEVSASKTEGTEEVKPTPEAQAKLDQGFVRFENQWVKPEQRAKILEGRRQVRAKKIAEAMAHRKWVNRYKLSTSRFEFEYTIDPEKMKEYAELMETYYRVFTKEWGITKPADKGKLKVCFYHDEDTYYQVSGAPRGAIGYFKFTPPEELNYYYDRLDERLTIDVMFHETNHYLTHLIDPKFFYPTWINESLAEYYGASQWDAKKKEMSVGHIQEGRLTVIQDAIAGGEWQGLEQLIRLEHAEFNATHYAWGWSFVHFLLQNPKYAKAFKQFYLSLARDKNIPRVSYAMGMRTVGPDDQIRLLLAALKVKELKTLEKEWHEYLKTLEAATHRGFLQAGQMALRWNMPIKAQRLFKLAIEKGSTSPMAYLGLARACLDKNQYADAADAYRKAIELDPLNGILYAGLARCRARELNDEKSDEVRRLRRLALEVDPDNDSLLFEVGIDEVLETEGAKATNGN